MVPCTTRDMSPRAIDAGDVPFYWGTAAPDQAGMISSCKDGMARPTLACASQGRSRKPAHVPGTSSELVRNSRPGFLGPEQNLRIEILGETRRGECLLVQWVRMIPDRAPVRRRGDVQLPEEVGATSAWSA